MMNFNYLTQMNWKNLLDPEFANNFTDLTYKFDVNNFI